MTEDALSPDAIARQVFEIMEAKDRVFIGAEMRALEIRAGYAMLEMTVRDDMLNGHGVCHGAALFSLADTAMAIAANSYNEVALAAAADINFVEPLHEGDTVRAEAIERSRRKRTCLYDVMLSGPEGKLIALFHGRTQRLRDKVVDHLPGPNDLD